MGLPTAIIYLVALFLFVPFPFMSFFNGDAVLVHEESPAVGTFPYHKVRPAKIWIMPSNEIFINTYYP